MEKYHHYIKSFISLITGMAAVLMLTWLIDETKPGSWIAFMMLLYAYVIGVGSFIMALFELALHYFNFDEDVKKHKRAD